MIIKTRKTNSHKLSVRFLTLNGMNKIRMSWKSCGSWRYSNQITVILNLVMQNSGIT